MTSSTQNFLLSRLSGHAQITSHACPNFNQRPANTDVSLIVVHNMSLPPGFFGGGYIESFFNNELDTHAHCFFKEIAHLQVSAHFCIRRCGAIQQFVDTQDRAWHAGESVFQGRANCNDFSIGIELEGTDKQAYTQMQYTALAHLCDSLMALYPKITPARIVGHSDIAPTRKTDPGISFHWPKLRQMLALMQNKHASDG